jgi:hypothetical protein
MTEKEWLKCELPKQVVEPLLGRHSERKARLFTVSCCCHLWNAITDPRSRNVVLTAERFVDGETQKAEMQAAMEEAGHALEEAREQRMPNTPCSPQG